MAGPEEGNILKEGLLQEAGWPWSVQNSIVMMAFFQNVPDFSGIFIYTPQSRTNTNQEATVRYWEYIYHTVHAQCSTEGVKGETELNKVS